MLAGVLSFASPKESSQRKGDPRVGGPSGFLALLGTGGGCGTRGCAPQTVLALFPPAPALLGAPHGNPKGGVAETIPKELACCGRLPKKGKNQIHAPLSTPDGLPGPLRGAEQHRNAGGSRLALSEPQASFASRPPNRVAQGTGAAGTDPGVAFSLATFFWRSKRKYARQQGGTPSVKKGKRKGKPEAGKLKTDSGFVSYFGFLSISIGLVFRLVGVLLSFASPKESKQRKGDPWVGAGQARSLALLGRPGGLPKLACGSNKASRLPPARLRCSASLKGPGKPSGAERGA